MDQYDYETDGGLTAAWTIGLGSPARCDKPPV